MPEQRVRMKLMRLASGIPHAAESSYVVSYDPNYHLPDGEYDGGALVTTKDPAEATLFTMVEAFQLWRSAPDCRCHRRRPDGEPNRPLSAFNVELT